MKFRTQILAILLLQLAFAGPAAAASKTTHVGRVDPTADTSLIRLLDSPQWSGARPAEEKRAAFSTVFPLQIRTESRGIAVPPRLTATAISTSSEPLMMLLLAAGVVVFHLRRKQKTLRHRPLPKAGYH